MKRLLAAALFFCLLCTAAFADTLVTNGGVSLDTGSLPYCTEDESAPAVYFIRDISPESLIAAYQSWALSVLAEPLF